MGRSRWNGTLPAPQPRSDREGSLTPWGRYKKVGRGRGADASRRRLRLHTVKALFLGLDLYVVRDVG